MKRIRWIVLATAAISGACGPAAHSGSLAGGSAGESGAGGSGEGGSGAGGSGGNAGRGGAGGGGTGGASGSGGSHAPDASVSPDAAGADTGVGVVADASAPDVSTPDARVSVPDGAGDGGRPSNPALDQRCTVPVTFSNAMPTSPGGMIFTQQIPDAVATMQALARTICNIIYRKPDEVRNMTREGLTVTTDSGVAFTVGGNITFSSDYIASFAKGKSADAIKFELTGVLAHESTHIWQNNGTGGFLIEAMADYVRYRVGYDKLSRRTRGGNWNQPYTVGGFFIVWIEDTYDKDFGYKVNLGMKSANFSYPDLVKQVTGMDIDAAWAAYQAAIP